MDVVIVDAVRTPIAARNGALRNWHSVDLLAAPLVSLVERTGVAPASIDEVISGCATPVGEQALNISRNAVLAAGWPETIASTTVDAQGVSGVVAFRDAVAAVSAGFASVVVAGAVSAMSRVPAGASTGIAVGKPFGPAVHERYAGAGGLVPPGIVAETMAASYGLDRPALDAYAKTSRHRAAGERTSGRGRDEIVPVALKNEKGVDTASSVTDDELFGAEVDDLLKPAFMADGVITAATFAPPADAAAALLLMSADAAAGLGITPMARVLSCALTGAGPLAGDSGATVAVEALKRAAVEPEAVDLVDVYEGDAATVLAFEKDLPSSAGKVNAGGGALATGDPYGAGGLCMLTGTVHRLRRSNGRYGLAVVAGSAGMGAAVVIERTET